MRRLLLTAAIALFTLGPAAAAGADRAPGPGFTLGARFGYGLPMGIAYKEAGAPRYFDDKLQYVLPIQIEGGYRFTPHLMLGGFVQWAPGFVAAAECPDAECSATDVRIGLEAIFRLLPRAAFDPWLGLGFGFEWASWSVGASGFQLRGLELVSLEAGGDFRLTQRLWIGPFVHLGIGRFSTLTEDNPGHDDVYPLAGADISTHQWVQIGVKGSYDF